MLRSFASFLKDTLDFEKLRRFLKNSEELRWRKKQTSNKLQHNFCNIKQKSAFRSRHPSKTGNTSKTTSTKTSKQLQHNFCNINNNQRFARDILQQLKQLQKHLQKHNFKKLQPILRDFVDLRWDFGFWGEILDFEVILEFEVGFWSGHQTTRNFYDFELWHRFRRFLVD